MVQTLTGLFESYADARVAVHALETAGIPHGDIGIVSRDREHKPLHADAAAEPEAVKGAEAGAVVGAAAGLLAGLGVLAIPGVGPVVAAGWLVSTAAGTIGGAAVGAAAGGLVGAFTRGGIPEREAHVYAESVRRGGTVVSARIDDSMVPEASRILGAAGAIDANLRRQAYESEGWTGFHDDARPGDPPLSRQDYAPVGHR